MRLGESRRDMQLMVRALGAAPLDDRIATDKALVPGVRALFRVAKPFARAAATCCKIVSVDMPYREKRDRFLASTPRAVSICITDRIAMPAVVTPSGRRSPTSQASTWMGKLPSCLATQTVSSPARRVRNPASPISETAGSRWPADDSIYVRADRAVCPTKTPTKIRIANTRNANASNAPNEESTVRTPVKRRNIPHRF
jgi:hypothetical protein